MTKSEQISIMKKVLEDFAVHGCRHDTNPTLSCFTPEQAEIVGFFYEYIKSMDQSVRERAQKALEKVFKDDIKIIKDILGVK